MPRLFTRMTARDTTEKHRASSPLELLFDLVFVSAIAQVAAQFAHAIVAGHAIETLFPFIQVFFAIWWAWMNFTWFASAFDTDDIPFRVLTLVQMAGVLVIAAGVPTTFEGGGFAAITVGYLIMRVGLIALWVRAAVQDVASRPTATRYALGLAVVQGLWLLRLAFPEGDAWWVFVLIALLDLSVPRWAERTGSTPWHAHHIAERYGLFTIILLGEGVLAATLGVQDALEVDGLSADLIVVALAGLVLLFTIWWLYFSEPAGEGLAVNRDRSFLWGFGHFFIFAALAALGSGLEVAVEYAGHHSEVAASTVSFAVAVPVAVFLVLLWAVHAPIVERNAIHPVATAVAVAAVLALPFATSALGFGGVLVGITVVVVALLAVTLVGEGRRSRVED
jgi:low temperature requirement protein LtrA